MQFSEKLKLAVERNRTLLCVGLDPDLTRVPGHLRTDPHPLFSFNRAIIDACAGVVCAFKPQFAHYAGQGMLEDLDRTLRYLVETCPEIPIILDAKRGDIGSTAAFYAREAFEQYGADAVTVNPYLGGDSLEPFFEHAERGVFVLCRTSNTGSRDFQGRVVGEGGQRLCDRVAELAEKDWSRKNDNVGLVVAATFPEDIERIREIAPSLTFLVPGIGAQGGDLDEVVKRGTRPDGAGLIISASRSVIYAGGGKTFDAYAHAEAEKLRDRINAVRPG